MINLHESITVVLVTRIETHINGAKLNKSNFECVIVTFTGHIHLLFEQSSFATKGEKFSSRKNVFVDLAIVCWG